MSLLAHWPIDDGILDTPTTARDAAAGGSGSHAGTYDKTSYSTLLPGGVGGRHMLCAFGGHIHSIGNPADFRNLHGEMTIAMWLWTDEFSSTFGLYQWTDEIRRFVSCSIANGGSIVTNNSFLFRNNGRKLHISWQHDANVTETIETTSDVLYPCGPQHIAVVRYLISGSTYGVRFYRNGQEVEDRSTGWTGPNGCDNAIPYIAKDYSGVNWLTLYFDSVRIYDEALNATAVEALYDSEEPLVHAPVSVAPYNMTDIGQPGDPYKLVHNGIFNGRQQAGWGQI